MSTTFFVRLESRTRSNDLAAGLAASVYDPAWMLGRQWQVGELLGEDAGSAVGIELDAETVTLTGYRPGSRTAVEPYDPTVLPLEALVEAEPRPSRGWTARARVDAGREFVRALRDAGADSYAAGFRQEFELARAKPAERAVDPAAARLLDVAAGRVPDGERLYRSLAKTVPAGDLPDEPPVAANDVKLVLGVAEAWLAWCDAAPVNGAGSAWDPERLEHRFSVLAGSGAGATVLDADGYRGGSLDWHSFDSRPVTTPTGFTRLPPISSLPTGVRFRGMPNARWWELEDSFVDLGSVDAGPSDVARLALLEFGLVYGNDFFAIPVRLPVGSLTRIRSLVVTDTFGMSFVVQPAAHGTSRVGVSRWSMFTLTERTPGQPGGGVSDLFFLPPIADQTLASSALEEVLLLRDEMANLAWAVERRYEGGSGAAVERIEEGIRQQPEPPPPTAEAALRYVLGTSVPPYWFPLVPVRSGAELRLKLQRMADQEAADVAPRGRLLELGGPAIHEEEVGREGVRLLCDYALTRWLGGSTVVWSRRRKRVGRGEGSSGLRFDAVEPAAPES